MKTQEIAYIILSFILIATFIAVFFFTYVSSVEGQIVNDQVGDVVSGFASDVDIFATASDKADIGKVIQENLQFPDMSREDKEVDTSNKKLLTQAIIVFATLLGIGLVIISVLWYKYRFNVLEIVQYSFLMLSIVAIVEFVFITVVVKNYRLIDTNYVHYLVLQELKNYANN